MYSVTLKSGESYDVTRDQLRALNSKGLIDKGSVYEIDAGGSTDTPNIVKTDRYKEFAEKYKDSFGQQMAQAGVDITKLDLEQQPEVDKLFNDYIVKQMRREVDDPTKSEFEQATPTEQARIASQKTGEPFDASYQRIAGSPRVMASELYDGSLTEGVFDRASDWFSGLGRAGRGGYEALTGGDPLKAMGETPKNTESFVGRLASDPMTPIGLGIGKAFGFGGNVLKEGLGRGLAGGTIQSALESGEEGKLIPASQMLGNLALNVAGESAGGMLGRGGSRVMKNSGMMAGADGAIDALEFAKLRPQNPLGQRGARTLQKPFTSSQDELTKAVGSEWDIGQEMVGKLKNFNEFMPEGPTIRPMLRNLPDSDIGGLHEAMLGTKALGKQYTKESSKSADDVVEAISFIEQNFPSGKPVNAEELFNLKQTLEQDINFNKLDPNKPMSKAVEEAYDRGRAYIRTHLEDLAEKSGNKNYKRSMKSMNEKYDVRDRMYKLLSPNEDVALNKAEGTVGRIYGKYKTGQEKTLKDFDELTGSNFSERAKNAKMADVLNVGDEGLPWMNKPRSVLDLSPTASPKAQANVIYPLADALKFVGERTGLGARTADWVGGESREAIKKGLFGGLGSDEYYNQGFN